MSSDTSDPALPSLVVKRGRSGNVHLVFRTSEGNLKANVKDGNIAGGSEDDADGARRRKIAALAEDFLRATKPSR